LAENQTKAWFEENRESYERDLRGPAVMLAEQVAAEFARRDLALTGDAKRSLFRINRDVRFSKDKSPYKTHAGLVWMRQGCKKSSPGILYLHIADEGCFASAAFYGLERPVLDTIREAIRYDGAGFGAAVAQGAKAGLSLEAMDPMTRLPRGFEDVSDPALASAIKARHLVLRRKLSKRDCGSAKLIETVVAVAEASIPFLEFGWDAVDADGPAPEWGKLK
jgi:uncharacterized protein (TIGR02453 family)